MTATRMIAPIATVCQYEETPSKLRALLIIPITNSNNSGDLVKQVRTPPVRPADGVVGGVYESFVPAKT